METSSTPTLATTLAVIEDFRAKMVAATAGRSDAETEVGAMAIGIGLAVVENLLTVLDSMATSLARQATATEELVAMKHDEAERAATNSAIFSAHLKARADAVSGL